MSVKTTFHKKLSLILWVVILVLLSRGVMQAQTVNESAKLLASDGAAGDVFGFEVAVSGDTAVVGAFRDDDKGTESGSAYVFVRSGTTWTQQAKLLASDGAAGDEFGFSVAVSGDTAVVGAFRDDDKGTESGSAYVFVRSGTTWTQQAKLLASDGRLFDIFGISIAVSGDTVVVGASFDDDNGSASGSAYVFARSGTTWTQQAKLLASDGAFFDTFGTSVAVSGDTAVVGAFRDDDKGTDSGSAYVFARSGTTWTQQAKLVASDGAAFHQFSVTVAVSGDTAVVGADFDDDKGSDAGSAYVFARSGTTWTQQAKLLASDGAAGDQFGVSVSVSGDTAVVGALRDDDKGSDAGSAYVFARSGATWTQQAKLVASDGAAGDLLGNWVAVSGGTAVVGAVLDDDKGTESGSAYVFDLDLPGALIQQLCEDVVALNLKQGITNSLDSKLDAVLQALDDVNENNDVAAINALQAFINAVEAQRGVHIPAADADTLIAAAQQIITLLQGG